VRYPIYPTLGPKVIFTNVQASVEVAQDETTEQVFSRKTDRKAYRAEVLGKRTEAQRTITEPEASTLGEKGKARSKAHRS
jgi:hypothetical protein